MPGDRFTASSKGLVCSQLALPFTVDEPCTITWEWSTLVAMNFKVTFTPKRGKPVRYTLAEHVGTAWADRGVPVVVAQPVTSKPEATAQPPVVVQSMHADSDRGTAEVEGSGEVVLSWNFEGISTSMLGGFFGVTHPNTQLRYQVTVDSTADVRAAAEAERARLAAAARELQAKKDELASLAQVEGESADAATAEAEASRKALDRLLPVLTEAEAAFAAQNSRVEAELAKLEAMQAPLRELKQATAAAEAARDAADQRAIECGAMREKHLEKLKKYEAGEGQAGGDNGGAGKAK